MLIQIFNENAHKIDNFDCGNQSLNIFLKCYASQQQKKSVGKTFVLVDDSNEVLGYYTLSAGSVSHQEAPRLLSSGLPKYPIPTVVLGRFAIHLLYQGKGLGGKLLRDALKRVLTASESMGIVAVIVHAKDEQAILFYKKYGFISFDNLPSTLYLTTKTIRDSVIKKYVTSEAEMLF